MNRFTYYFFIFFLPLIFTTCNSNFNSPDRTQKKSHHTNPKPFDIKKEKTVKDTSPMMYIPEGTFIMGSNESLKKGKSSSSGGLMVKGSFTDQYPQRNITLPAFYIDKYEVKNRQYKKFIDDVSYPSLPDHWTNGTYPAGRADHPVSNVLWADANHYCLWAEKSLPTEEQWEKAARGDSGRIFSFGDEYNIKKANIGLNEIKDSMPAGSFPDDVSPYGVYDLTGNVSEWTADWYKPYPGNSAKNSQYGEKFKVLRGASFMDRGHYFKKEYAHSSFRLPYNPKFSSRKAGFRCASPVKKKSNPTIANKKSIHKKIDLLQMTKIPAGTFIMGNDDEDTQNRAKKTHSARQWFVDERPRAEVFVDTFYIDTYEVTNAQYKKFLDKTHYRSTLKHWVNGTYEKGYGDHPVTNVSWFDANAYAVWSGKRLPTESEWEKAARGTDGRRYTWGNSYDAEKGNIGLLLKNSAAIGSFKEDVSSYGVYDMAGNVAEWTSSWYKAYPGSDYDSDLFGEIYKVARGGFFLKTGHIFLDIYVYTTHRISRNPLLGGDNIGFRTAFTK